MNRYKAATEALNTAYQAAGTSVYKNAEQAPDEKTGSDFADYAKENPPPGGDAVEGEVVEGEVT